jgi:excisionase family DNA binding protein
VFTAAQAAQVLGISERRVRQLVTEGKLPGERGADNVVRVPQQAVNEERKRRRGAGIAKKAASPAKAGRARKAPAEPMDVDALAERVASAVGQRIEGQLEITHRAESLLRGELDEERARRMQSEAQLQELRVELADAQERLVEARRQVTSLEGQLQQAQAKRGLFRR